jgi:hypothetical protein
VPKRIRERERVLSKKLKIVLCDYFPSLAIKIK